MGVLEREREMYIYICITLLRLYFWGAPQSLQIVIAAMKLKDTYSLDFPCGSDGKVSTYNAGDLGSIPGSGRYPGEGNGNPCQYSCLERSHGWRSYSPWDHKESDMTGWLQVTSFQ